MCSGYNNDMKGKMHGNRGPMAADDIRAEILNPFVHNVELDTTFDKIKTAIFTVVLLPFRVMVICWLLVTAWFLACLGLYGLSEQDLRSRPMTGWRRAMRPVLCRIGKWSYLAGGMAITIKGKQASRHEAPILVVAPHSTFLDSCIVYATRMSSVIVRRESMDNYVGKLINYTQPVYVWRDDPNSRQNTIKEIIGRATSPDWPQILIFPEGTCTNRSCLITFKPGGFYPGVPVQPVTIRYPNHLDTVTWTWEGPSALKLLWLTLTRVHTACEIEFLPVYRPSEAEKKDPKLYASNVRNVMAKALGIPVSDYTYDDCRLLCRAKQLNIPHATSLVEAQKHRQTLGLDSSRKEMSIIDMGGKLSGTAGTVARVNYKQFCQRLDISEADTTSQALFAIFVEKKTGETDWRDYLMSAAFLSLPGVQTSEILSYAFKIYDESGVGRLTHEDVVIALSRCAALAHEEGSAAFQQVDVDARGWITSEEFFKFAEKKVEFAFLFHSEDAITKVKTQ